MTALCAEPGNTASVTDVEAIKAEIQRRLEPARRNPRDSGHGQDQYLDCIERLVCADGFSVSAQTGYSHYCQPRDGHGPWHMLELGYPSRRVEAFMGRIDDANGDPTDTVYGYVPLHTLAQVIADAGGLLPEGSPDPFAETLKQRWEAMRERARQERDARAKSSPTPTGASE